MLLDPAKFRLAIERLDQANAQDPHKIDSVPAELLYAERMTQWLDRLYPDAPETLKIAVRAQHIQRWAIPRSRFPITRAGYLAWRKELYTFHADTAAQILRDLNFDPETIDRVRSLIKKEKLKSDPDTQALEDVACLVFLESYFADFAPRHDADKVVGILKRTWAKMSPKGRQAAASIQLSDDLKLLLAKALEA